MIRLLAGAVIAGVVAVRIWFRVRRHRTTGGHRTGGGGRSRLPWAGVTGDVGLVASRELRERFRGRVFRVGTLFILAVVAGAIVIPTLTSSPARPRRLGVVGALPPATMASVTAAARGVGTTVVLVPEPSTASARAALHDGRIDAALVDGSEIVVEAPIRPGDTSATAQFVRAAASSLGVTRAFEAARLTPTQVATVAGARPLPVSSIQPGTGTGSAKSTSVVGLVLVFMMLTQYNTWILMGVMEEKSSRVIEVLLATVRPLQLLTGKVLGIGLVAFAQASLVVAFALALAEGVGSPLLHGTAPLVLVSTLLWLVLGYAFYCWVYAAAGSMVERQDQVQGLALPLSLPLVFGYITGLMAAGTGSASALVTVLAYVPLTAPFSMPVLVALGAVTWWQFTLSAVISIASTVAVARLAATVYRQAILRTGGRVRLRALFATGR